jgi:hypothetical protein
VCHGELAKDRPPPAQLTEFYLWLALGGVLGGMFNAIVAPLIFPRVLEYPLAIILVCLLRPGLTSINRFEWGWPLLLGAIACAVVLTWQALGFQSSQLSVGLMAGIPAVVCYLFVDRPLRFALGLAAVLLAGAFYTGNQGKTIHIERNFFGVIRVTLDRTGQYKQLVHGSTIHGRQSLDPERSQEPLAYFHRSGPIGKAFAFFNPRHPTARVGVIGLGAGSLACYALPGQKWTFYEIDPAVQRIAEESFTFLRDSPAGPPEILIGDARLRLQEAVDGSYDMIVLDAFSSDVVPVHLLTREAMALYLSKLSPSGVLCFHCSSRYLDLKPVIANVARDAGLTCLAREDLGITRQEKEAGKEPSQWMMMARPGSDLDIPSKRGLWEPMRGDRHARVWTDDYSNILEVFKWELPESKD